MSTLKGLNALVCGSTQGIGKACAVELARLGATVTLMARDEMALQRVTDELHAEHGQTHGYICVDFIDWQAVRDKAREHVSETGIVHILLNNTGGPPAGPAIEAAPEAFLAAFQQHLICNQVLVQAAVEPMKRARYGRIINIISSSVIQPIPNLGVSNTIRGAVANWGRALAGELAEHGITVNNILPGYTDTARLASLFEKLGEGDAARIEQARLAAHAKIPAQRFADPAEIGMVAAFLASPAASYVNGVNLPVDGGKLARQ
ncbi:MAG: SDR family oxidoreductase [Phycisphaerales bacterium]|nr:MAG: SDR family oxidoreductase [Phycisphaerales bacterium]